MSFRLTWHGPAVERELKQGAARGLLLAAEHVLGVSNEVVPLDESPLMHSGVASVEESSLTGMVSYDTPYAVIQHENLRFRHAPGRTAKYLENSLNGARTEVLALITAQMRRAMR
ncbi:hypothetical protein JHN52_01020 [Streptomyces sp. MBT97]|uniref:hypothetical protein n=1 Tax=Streptomyces sp. MBT97 TaxID=2800411 RepID=UPI0019098DBF|nr:hypothetical protein [Streptomyces sp. MBT97]MBK3631562.1 hypothetical protein [Streptomyces sp. MBT97]